MKQGKPGKKLNRRAFVKGVGAGALCSALIPGAAFSQAYDQAADTQPDFQVLTLTYKHPTNSALDRWEPIGLDPITPIESGLNVALVAQMPPGGVDVRWYQDGAIFAAGPVTSVQFPGPATPIIRMRVLDSARKQIAEVTKTVYVGGGLRFIAMSAGFSPHILFEPNLKISHEARTWVLSRNGDIAYADISDPQNLATTYLQVIGREPSYYAGAMALANGSGGASPDHLFIAAGDKIYVWEADPPLRTRRVGQFDLPIAGSLASGAVVCRDCLVISCAYPGSVFEYEGIADLISRVSAGAPVEPTRTFGFPENVVSMHQHGTRVMASHGSALWVRDYASTPPSTRTANLDSPIGRVWFDDSRAIIETLAGFRILDSYTLEEHGRFNRKGAYWTATRNRIYHHDPLSQLLTKQDLTDPQAIYTMDVLSGGHLPVVSKLEVQGNAIIVNYPTFGLAAFSK